MFDVVILTFIKLISCRGYYNTHRFINNYNHIEKAISNSSNNRKECMD